MQVIAFAGGHSYDSEAFHDFARSLPGEITIYESPDGLIDLPLSAFDGVDVSVHYDMPGVFPQSVEPTPALADRFATLADRGHGFVMLHHSLASWPMWPEWSQMLGGSFLYRPARLHGVAWPDSGYVHDVVQQFETCDPTHPVLAGVPASFTLTDEPYLCPVFEDEVTPLLITDADRTDSTHFSAQRAIDGDLDSRKGWNHPVGSRLAAWARPIGKGRLVYVQPGDTRKTLADPIYRHLVGNAVRWAAKRETIE